MFSSQVKMNLRSKSAPSDKPYCPPLTTADLCSTNTPFSTSSAKLNAQVKTVKLSATLPILTKNKSSINVIASNINSTSTNSNNHSINNSRNGNTHNTSDSTALRNSSVSAANEKLKIALAKSMPRPLPKEMKDTAVTAKNRVMVAPAPKKHAVECVILAPSTTHSHSHTSSKVDRYPSSVDQSVRSVVPCYGVLLMEVTLIRLLCR